MFAENHPIWMLARTSLLVVTLVIVCAANYQNGFDWKSDPRGIVIVAIVLMSFDASKKAVYTFLRRSLGGG